MIYIISTIYNNLSDSERSLEIRRALRENPSDVNNATKVFIFLLHQPLAVAADGCFPLSFTKNEHARGREHAPSLFLRFRTTFVRAKLLVPYLESRRTKRIVSSIRFLLGMSPLDSKRHPRVPPARPCLDDLQERAQIHQHHGESLCLPFDRHVLQRLDHSYWSQDAIFGKKETMKATKKKAYSI